MNKIQRTASAKLSPLNVNDETAEVVELGIKRRAWQQHIAPALELVGPGGVAKFAIKADSDVQKQATSGIFHRVFDIS